MEQHYISELRDESGHMVDFERWSYKRAATVISKLHELYTGWGAPIYANDLKRSAYVVICPTLPNGCKSGEETRFTVSEILKGVES